MTSLLQTLIDILVILVVSKVFNELISTAIIMLAGVVVVTTLPGVVATSAASRDNTVIDKILATNGRRLDGVSQRRKSLVGQLIRKHSYI